MKKIITGTLISFIMIFLVFFVKSREVFQEVNETLTAQPVMVNLSDTSVKEEEVRIVIKTPSSETIYRNEITFSAKELKLYWGKKYSNVKSYDNVTIKVNGKLFDEKKVVKITSDNKIKIKGYANPYQGSFYIYKTKKGLVLVNQVKMNDYLAAVISSEMNEEFPLEALKAQAICARTYIKNTNADIYDKFDADGDDSTSYQVYNKIAPGKNCIKAAKDTNGIVMTWNGKLIDAFYFSTSCGYTTNYKIWGTDELGYLKKTCLLENKNTEIKFKKFIKSKPEGYESEYPYYRWNVYLSSKQIVNSVWNELGVNIGKLKNIKIEKRGAGGIVAQLLIIGSKKEVLLTNQNQIRKILCSEYSNVTLNDGESISQMSILPSAFICIDKNKKKGTLQGIKIYGGGFGHGSGMSQNAAKEMALSGIKYTEILKKFYNGIDLITLQ